MLLMARWLLSAASLAFIVLAVFSVVAPDRYSATGRWILTQTGRALWPEPSTAVVLAVVLTVCELLFRTQFLQNGRARPGDPPSRSTLLNQARLEIRSRWLIYLFVVAGFGSIVAQLIFSR